MARRRSASDARAEIRRAALELFLQHGYDATALEEVAERVGVTRPAVLYHFGSKEALLRSIVDPGFERIEEILAAFEDEGTGVSDQEEIVRALVDVVLAHRQEIALITRFTNAYPVADIGARAQRANLRAAVLLGGPRLADDPATRVRVVATLSSLAGLMDPRVPLPLATDDERETLVRGLVAMLKS